MSATSSAITVVSPPNGLVAVAITVSEPPSRRLRASGERLAGGLRMQAVEAVDQHERVPAAGRHALGGIHGALHRLALRVGGGGEAERRHRRHRALLPLRDLLGPHAGQHQRHLDVAPAETAASRLRRVSVLPACAAPTITAREPRPNGVSHSIASSVGSKRTQREPLARVGDGQVLVAGALGDGRPRMRR